VNRLSHQIADLLLAIEAELRRLGLWETTPPKPEQLASLIPFCHDTLEFHQWLQWLFLPQMKQIIEQELILPSESEIEPIAEHSLQKLGPDGEPLLTLITQFDRLITRQT